MATQTIKAEFLPDDHALEVTSTPEVHDIAYEGTGAEVPTVLENPHVDFPGSWTLIGQGEGGTYRYGRTSAVADTSGSAAD